MLLRVWMRAMLDGYVFACASAHQFLTNLWFLLDVVEAFMSRARVARLGRCEHADFMECWLYYYRMRYMCC